MSVVKAIIGLIRIMGRTFVRNNNPRSPISSIQQVLLDIEIGFDNKDPYFKPKPCFLKAFVLVIMSNQINNLNLIL